MKTIKQEKPNKEISKEEKFKAVTHKKAWTTQRGGSIM